MGDHDPDLMIGGASVEDTLTLWASSLRDAKQRIPAVKMAVRLVIELVFEAMFRP
ncbi:hypothetical protein KUL72_30730 [Bradyrhizobium arachidis]|uniref:hypothetical protein n=1 Tax=Bradyrhizobium arachidis TaxID=858423 RepID=UPI0021616E0F|nr:hypothetical protein [Bradyrhizobium arachidis]UVO35718.1 hypothetical protein KUL72_30730 [Bradyrhizobium arachidis]